LRLRHTGSIVLIDTVELTESAVMEDAQSAIISLRELKALGVRLAVDDFETGYSSLSYLKRFPMDYLKIDRSFVEGFRKDPEDKVLVSRLTALTHTSNMRVIAEGVESTVQMAQLY
jgi:EAL domain-containing protein (putative c-di-GMP-specific phosphodiesterase class I)